MKELKIEEVQIISGGGIGEAFCVGGFGALGTIGGFIVGGAASGGIGMGAGVMWGFGLGTNLGAAVCLP